ncbi:hypothetical protein DL240_03295 [Lujinxingia litoralis]|uniref:Uncharacterized protein n=1 Tax=Lujinxingia litoralis TaxID=2211119 RepID=A0A328CC89_9DELT|nr:hypothetical protein [Lujinxingia litoralis]RAL25250.1 hypothetical protein DL240_03295 [Lujinxingia litoralis]
MSVPAALRRWFIVHFVADLLFALPLMVAPTAFLTTLGWESVDPISARLVGAALIGIGVESWLGRDRPAESYRTMLRVKMLWSASAALGIAVSMVQGAPQMGWGFFGIFAAFNLLWTYWYRRLARQPASGLA